MLTKRGRAKRRKHEWYPDDSGNWLCACGAAKRMTPEEAEKMWESTDAGPAKALSFPLRRAER